MKELIPINDYGLFADMKSNARVDSRFVAKMFGKRHSHVLRDIEKITEPKSGLSEEFIKNNFSSEKYQDSTGRKLLCYQMTRDGFTMLVMGYTGKKAMKFKELYIKQFNKMEEFIKTLVSAREMFPTLTENIRLIQDNPRPYHFSNECDMINKLVLGKTAKQFREENGIDKGESIRPYLTDEEIKMIDKLQKLDSELIIAIPDFQARKRQLEWYLSKTKNQPSERELKTTEKN